MNLKYIVLRRLKLSATLEFLELRKKYLQRTLSFLESNILDFTIVQAVVNIAGQAIKSKGNFYEKNNNNKSLWSNT